MKFDALKQYAKLHEQLLSEKSQLESRLNEINQVLGNEPARSQPEPSSTPAQQAAPAVRRGRRPKASGAMSLREAVLKALSNGPIARKDLVNAVQEIGYKFNTKNPLNSIGSVLYAKNTPIKNADGKFYVEGGAQAQASGNGDSGPRTRGRKKKRVLSPEGREKIAAAARARWAKRNKS